MLWNMLKTIGAGKALDAPIPELQPAHVAAQGA